MSKETILVVEDEAIEGIEIQETLQKKGYIVPPVIASGDEVLKTVMRYKPHLIIMDIRLKSFIDGIDAAQRLRLLGQTPIIFVTAYPTKEIKERAMKTNPAAYLVKPVREEELISHVEKALKKAG